MRVAVAGANGMLGSEVVRTLVERGHDVVPLLRSDFDIQDDASCVKGAHGVDAVVNAAAYTAVDDAEDNEAVAFGVNAAGVANLARACRASGTRFIQISTDYVFDGHGEAPYEESAAVRPLGAYGRSKAAGEWAARAEDPASVVVRTAWLYGPGGGSFVKTMGRLSGEREVLDVVDDQRGQPTTTRDVARFVERILSLEVPGGIYHATSRGETTWFGLARAVFELLGLDPSRVRPISTDAYPVRAPRPRYSVLGHRRTTEAGLPLLPQWREALEETLPAVMAAASPGARTGTVS